MAAKDSSPMVKLIVLIGILIVSSSLLYFLNDPAIGVLEVSGARSLWNFTHDVTQN